MNDIKTITLNKREREIIYVCLSDALRDDFEILSTDKEWYEIDNLRSKFDE